MSNYGSISIEWLQSLYEEGGYAVVLCGDKQEMLDAVFEPDLAA
ncbi:hypothetical protein [Rouxiella badensis]|nr:hypothetical protein [Rouxiella badensis]WAT10106.1 hypothetical protein O1V65_05965 [Rouxiella badensis]